METCGRVEIAILQLLLISFSDCSLVSPSDGSCQREEANITAPTHTKESVSSGRQNFYLQKVTAADLSVREDEWPRVYLDHWIFCEVAVVSL